MAAAPDPLHFPRTVLAKQIVMLFEQNMQPAITIFAHRRKGKTTFVLKDLIPLAREHGFLVAMADLWLDKDHPERAIARALEEAIHGTGLLRRNMMRMKRPGSMLKSIELGAGADGGTVKAELAQGTVLQLPELFERFRQLGKGKALLIIDEVQHLATRPEFENLTATLRTLLQATHGEVFAVFTGSSQHGLTSMFRRSKAPFYQYSSGLQFPNLGREFAMFLGEKFREVTGRDWDTERAYRHYMNRGEMPKYLRDLYTVSLTHNIDVESADQVVWDSMMDESGFDVLFQELTALEQALLGGILSGESLFSNEYRERLADELPSGRAPSTTQIQSALKRLQRRDLVGNLDRGEWRIEDAALESYLRRLLLEE